MASSALSGGVMGAGVNALSRGATLGNTLRAGGVGAALGAGLAGASGTIGDLILGDPEKGEKNGYTKRGALGGLVAGGALGALGGGLAASGKLGALLSKTPKVEKGLKSLVGKESVFMHPNENFLLKALIKNSENPTAKATLVGALGGTALGGAAAAGHGADEGMQADFLTSMAEAERRRRKAKQ